MNKELVFLRTFAAATVIGMIFIVFLSMKNSGNQKFSVIDVERINIVEKDGTVRMVITNVERFPSGHEIINNRKDPGITGDIPEWRPKSAGMLFFNEDGSEAGGFGYSAQKNENGHAAFLSLTFDQYDGDQVMQLLTSDIQQEDERFVRSLLIFTDRSPKVSQPQMVEITRELNELREIDPQKMMEKYREYEQQGLMDETHRIVLGKLDNQDNGLFLFDDKGTPSISFF